MIQPGSQQNTELVLASKSQVRFQLLCASGLKVNVQEADINERAIESEYPQNITSPDVALALASAKALKVSRHSSQAVVIGADQILECEGTRLHKADTIDVLREKLLWLSGKTHSLVTAIAVAKDKQILWSHTEKAALKMRVLTPDFIDYYIDSVGDSVLQSVGGYQLEGLGAQLFEQIEGDYFTILGLPLLPLLEYLRTQTIIGR